MSSLREFDIALPPGVEQLSCRELAIPGSIAPSTLRGGVLQLGAEVIGFGVQGNKEPTGFQSSDRLALRKIETPVTPTDAQRDDARPCFRWSKPHSSSAELTLPRTEKRSLNSLGNGP